MYVCSCHVARRESLLFAMNVKVLIPAYKPDDKLLILIEQLISAVDVLVIDDGSGTDFSSVFDKARQLGATTLHHERNLGKGAALKTGIRHIRDHEQETSLVTADADGQHSARDILRIVDLMREHSEALLLGVRNVGRMPIKSRLGNSITQFFFRLVTKLDISDTQTGLRGLPYPLFDRLLCVEGDRYEYEMNMLLSLKEWDVPFREIRIDTIYIDNNSRSHFHALRDGVRVFSRVLKYCASSLICAALDFGLYTLSITWFPIVESYAFARVISAIANYQLNRRMVFRAQASIRSVAGYFLLALCVMAAGSLSVSLLSNIGMNKVLAKVFVDGILFICNYLLQKKVVFRKKE